jgi:hypothetical protein
MAITADSFPTPDLIKVTNNPAAWDQLERFSHVQAVAANRALSTLTELIDRQRVSAPEAFERVYLEVSAWRHAVAQEKSGQRPGAAPEHYKREIRYNVDLFGPGVRRDGSWLDFEKAAFVGGRPTPGSRVSERLAKVALARFAAEAPDADFLRTIVRLPDGSQVAGNMLMRGTAVGMNCFNVDRSFDGLVATVTAERAERAQLRLTGFEALAHLDGMRATGNLQRPHDGDAHQVFADAAYYLYQGPQFHRGSDATTRVLLAAAHTRIFGAPPRLPHDVDVQAYIVGQQSFRDHMRLNLTVVPNQAVAVPRTTTPRNLAATPSQLRQSRDAIVQRER